MTTAEQQTDDAVETARPGAPAGNRNAWRHGLYSPTRPQPGTYTDKMGNEYRRHIEDRALEIYGEVGAYEAGLIQSATEATKTAMEIMDRVKKYGDAMKVDQVVTCYTAYLRALDMRDRKAKELGIALPALGDRDLWSTIDSLPPATAETSSNANESQQDAGTEPATSDTVQLSTSVQNATTGCTEPPETQ